VVAVGINNIGPESRSHFGQYNETLEYMSYSWAIVDMQKIFGFWAEYENDNHQLLQS